MSLPCLVVLGITDWIGKGRNSKILTPADGWGHRSWSYGTGSPANRDHNPKNATPPAKRRGVSLSYGCHMNNHFQSGPGGDSVLMLRGRRAGAARGRGEQSCAWATCRCGRVSRRASVWVRLAGRAWVARGRAGRPWVTPVRV